MVKIPNSFREVCAAWPSLKVMHEDVGAGYSAVRMWKSSDWIPAEYWQRVIDRAKEHGIRGISARRLVEFADRRLPD